MFQKARTHLFTKRRVCDSAFTCAAPKTVADNKTIEKYEEYMVQMIVRGERRVNEVASMQEMEGDREGGD